MIAIKTNPALWERVKRSITKGIKGGPSGKWSARKAQLAVKEYKRLGGSYKGKKQSSNSLTKWSREKWNYISPKGSKRKTGRYLPEVVRKHLSKKEKAFENKRKGSKRGQWVSYGSKVSSLMRKYILPSSKRTRQKKR